MDRGLVAVALVWGISIIGDSAQFSAIMTEVADQAYVGTALTVQLAMGFLLTGVTIWLVPWAAAVIGWQWVFLVLAPGPVLGVLVMVPLSAQGWGIGRRRTPVGKV